MKNVNRIKNNAAHAEAIAGGHVVTKSAVLSSPPVVDFDQRLVKGLISTCDVDADNEVVQCHKLDLSYFPTSVSTTYIDHNYERYPLGVGVCRSLAVRGKSLYASTYVSPGSIGDDLLTAINIGALKHFSIGAVASDFGPPTPAELIEFGPHGCNIRAGRLIEYSFTAMPANKEAMIEAVSKSLIRRESAVAFGLDDSPVRKFFPTHGPAVVSRPTLLIEFEDGEWGTIIPSEG